MNAKMSQIQRVASGNTRSIARGRRAVMEAVESRLMMSVTTASPNVNVYGTNVTQTVSTVVAGTVGKATQAVVTAVPTSLSAGGGGVIVVHLADANGNVDLSQAGTVTLAIASGPVGATLSGTVSATAVNGVATFNDVVVTKAGDYTFKAVATGLTSVTSTVTHVTAAAASQLAVISQPVLALLGQAVQPVVVAVEDLYGNVVTTASSVVTLATQAVTAATTAAINVPTATVTAVNGVATFSNLTITTVGTDVLTATTKTLAAATSAPVTVTVAHTTPTTTPTPSPTPTVTPAPTPVIVPIATLIAGAKSAAVTIDVSASLPSVALAKAKAAQTVQLSIASSADGTIALSGAIHVKAGLAMLPKLSLHVAGTYTVTLTDATGATVTQSIVVQPAAAAKLVFTKLPSLLNGTATAAVQAIDRWGNLTAAADGAAVTLSLGHGSTFGKLAALTGATTATLEDGVATFTGGLSVSSAINPGGYAKLTASLGKLTVSTDATYTIA